MSTLFTKIIQGELPAYKIYEDEKHFAFLSIEPLIEGHTLLVPKREAVIWTDLTQEEATEIFEVALALSKRLKHIFDVPRVGLIITGFQVNHTHLHLIPCRNEEDLNFSHAKKAKPAELEMVQKKIEEYTFL